MRQSAGRYLWPEHMWNGGEQSMEVLTCGLGGRIPAVHQHFLSSLSLGISADCLSAWPASPSCFHIFPSHLSQGSFRIFLICCFLHKPSMQFGSSASGALAAALCICRGEPFVCVACRAIFDFISAVEAAVPPWPQDLCSELSSSCPRWHSFQCRWVQRQCTQWRCQFLCRKRSLCLVL